MTDSNSGNSSNGEQNDRQLPGRSIPEGGSENKSDSDRPARPPRRENGDGGDHWYSSYKHHDESGGDRPSFRPYKPRDNRDGNGGEDGDRPSFRPYKPRDNRDGNGGEGGDRPYRPRYNRYGNGGSEGGDRPYRPRYNRYGNGGSEGGEGSDRPYRPRYNRDGNGGEGGDRPYRPRYNRDENGGENGDRPYRPYKPRYNRDGNGSEGGDRPYRPRYNRDGNDGEGGDRPYRPRYNRDGNGSEGGEGGDRPYRPRYNRDGNGSEGGDRPYRPRYNRDGNSGEGGDRPYRPRYNRDGNGDRPPRRFGDRRENGTTDEMSERSVIDSNRKDDIAISGDRPYRPYSPYLMEDDNGVMHASYRPFRKSYEVDANGIAHPPRKTEGPEGEEAHPPRDFGNNDGKGADNATWTFSNQDEKAEGDEKTLTEHHDGDDMHLEEALSEAETQSETPSGASMEAAGQTSEATEQKALPENGSESQNPENKDDASKDAWPRHDRSSRRDGDGYDRPRRRFDRDGNGDGYDRPRRRFDRDGNGDVYDRPPRRFNRDENGNGFDRWPRRRFERNENGESGEQPQEGTTEAGAVQNPAEAEQPLPYARKQRIAVFGGSFDPIHNGHLLIAQKVLELDKADEVLFVPALLPPHKMNGLVATPEQRLEMVKLALAPYEKCSFTDVELQRTGPSYTFDTMSILKQIYSACELYLLIGMDSLLGLHSWYRATELVTRGKFIIYPRPGSERPPIYELEKEFGSKNAYKLYYSILNDEELAQSDVSSTAIREAVAQHLTLEKYVPQAVAQYIHDNNIYS